jgi:hypothetical protein
MAIQQKPVVGNWYVNLTGQLLKICAVSYDAGNISKVVIEFLSGKKLILDLDKWNLLDLETYIYKSSGLINQQT